MAQAIQHTGVGVVAVANAIILECGRQLTPVTFTRLNRLLYLAHGWSLALHKRPLTAQQPTMSPFGPYYAQLHDAYRHHNDSSITDPARNRCGAPIEADLGKDDLDIIAVVVKSYGKLPYQTLTRIVTFKGDLAWNTPVIPGSNYAEIPDEKSTFHFQRKCMQKVD